MCFLDFRTAMIGPGYKLNSYNVNGVVFNVTDRYQIMQPVGRGAYGLVVYVILILLLH